MTHPQMVRQLLKIEKEFYESLENLSSESPMLKPSEMSPSGSGHAGEDSLKINPLSISLERADGG